VAELVLTERQQGALRRVLGAGTTPCPDDVLRQIQLLIDCDTISTVPARGTDEQASTAPQVTHATDRRLVLSYRCDEHHTCQLELRRTHRPFASHDITLLSVLAPFIELVLQHRPPPQLPESVTPQERRVLMLVASGLGTREIAQRLYVAPGTVSKHLENAYRKLGVSNRVAAVNAMKDLLVEAS
jgi:DNA-binding CsgD family transcriptional regulator